MEAKIGKFFDSVGSFFSGGDQIPWCDRDIIGVSFLYFLLRVLGHRYIGFQILPGCSILLLYIVFLYLSKKKHYQFDIYLNSCMGFPYWVLIFKCKRFNLITCKCSFWIWGLKWLSFDEIIVIFSQEYWILGLFSI